MDISKTKLVGTRLAGPDQRERWDNFVSNHPTGHLLQSYAWGEFKQRYDWPAVRVIVPDGDGKIVAGAQVLFRQMFGHSIAYVPKGPVVDWNDPQLVKPLLAAIKIVAHQNGAIYLKIEPNEFAYYGYEATIGNYGFKVSTETIQPPSTIRVDLNEPPERWLERMKHKTRYNIRLAERRGVSCRLADSQADFEAFYNLMQTTGERDAFGIHSSAYYNDAWRIFQEAPVGNGALWLAEFEDRVVAGVMIFTFGKEAAYLYGASSDESRREMPTYLLQWKAMNWAKEQGATSYDFWGIPDNLEEQQAQHENDTSEQKNVRDGLWGVYRFKQGFGGDTFRYMGAYDLVYNRPFYALWQKVKRFRP